MDKYKINFIFGNDDINDIFINTLICELKKNIMMICKTEENELSLPVRDFLQKEVRIVREFK